MSIVRNILVAFLCLMLCMLLILVVENWLESQSADWRAPVPRTAGIAAAPLDRQLFDLHLEYLLNSLGCSADVLAVILVTSYAGNIETRSAMRRALPGAELAKRRVRRVFLLAEPPASDKYAVGAAALRDEHQRFGDLIQGNFTESYRNLTYKHVMGLQWSAGYCGRAKFVVKMDDDIVIDFDKVVALLEELAATGRHRDDAAFLGGYVLRDMRPVREPANKWYVTRAEFAGAVYPAFVSGWLYVTTPRLAGLLARLSHTVPYFWIDDVYVTGVLAAKLDVTLQDLRTLFTVHPEFLECCMRDVVQHGYDCPVVVGPNGGDVGLFVRFNARMHTCEGGRCAKRPPDKRLDDTCVAAWKGVPLQHGDARVHRFQL